MSKLIEMYKERIELRKEVVELKRALTIQRELYDYWYERARLAEGW